MLTVKRFDRGGLAEAKRTPQGFLRAPAYLTRTGVLTYRTPDGEVRRELRLPEEVFHPDSLASLASIPVTNDHPPVMVSNLNAKEFMVGYTSDGIEQDGDKVKTFLTITDADAIAAAESGRQQISCGYFADLEEKSGIWNGETYDAIQRNIRYNHVAMVDRGRAGHQVRMRLDSADGVGIEDDSSGNDAQNKTETSKMKIMLGGKEFDVSPELHAAIMAEMGGSKKAATDEGAALAKAELAPEMEKKDAEISKLQAKCDAQAEDLKKRVDAADPKAIGEAVKARRAIEKIAERVLPASEHAKMDSLSDLDLKTQVVKTHSPEAVLEGKSVAYVDARFDHVAETLGASDRKAEALGAAALSTERNDGADDVSARKKMLEESANAWKQPLSANKA